MPGFGGLDGGVLSGLPWGPILLAVGFIALLTLALEARERATGPLGAAVVTGVGLVAFAGISWAALWLLAVTAGFYESLTCKIVSIPGCEAPLALPGWLALPQQSAGGVLGVLPLAAVYLLKVAQREPKPLELPDDLPLVERAGRRLLQAIANNAGLIFAVAVELWLAVLRGQAEAADRQVRLALGLDTELPAAYFEVARWGAVVLGLGLSAAVLALGVAGRAARVLTTDALARLGWGAVLAELLVAAVVGVARALRALARAVATSVGWTLLVIGGGLRALWRGVSTAIGAALLALWGAGRWLVTVLALAIGRPIVWAGSVPGRLRRWRSRGSGVRGASPLLLPLLGLALLAPVAEASTWVVLVDATGSEASRLGDTNRQILTWADPDPNRSLLARGDRLVVIPIRAPGRLDATYPVAFSAVYPDDQLGRYAFFAQLRDALPSEVDRQPGTDLSASLRAAAAQLERYGEGGERTLLVFGNGEDHAEAVTPAELVAGLAGARVAHLALGEEAWERWEGLYRASGATPVVLFDLAATRSLGAGDLREALAR